MKTNTPQDLKKLFETMQEDVLESHHLSSEYLADIVNVIIGITEKCESGNDSSMDEWKGFKCIRNGLRGLINIKKTMFEINIEERANTHLLDLTPQQRIIINWAKDEIKEYYNLISNIKDFSTKECTEFIKKLKKDL